MKRQHASPSILILTASAGAGHTVAARAMSESISERLPHATVEVHDVLDSSGPVLRRLYADGYMALVHYAPAVMGLLYDAMDAPPSRLTEFLRGRAQDVLTAGTVRFLLERRPTLIVNTHFLSAEIVARLRRAGRLHCPQVTVTTDFETFRLWVQPPTEQYFTATESGKALLSTWGVDPADVVVSGIPVRRAFCDDLDRIDLRRQHGLIADQPVVVLSCGGLGVPAAEQHLRQLAALPERVQVIAISGRDERLRVRLAARFAPRVRVLGFTDRMHEWMRVADLLVGKPGGLTSSEALVCGVPLVVVRPIPGHEARNGDYLLESGAAIKPSHVGVLRHRIIELLSEPSRLVRMRTACRRIARPDAARLIAEHVARRVGPPDISSQQVSTAAALSRS